MESFTRGASGFRHIWAQELSGVSSVLLFTCPWSAKWSPAVPCVHLSGFAFTTSVTSSTQGPGENMDWAQFRGQTHLWTSHVARMMGTIWLREVRLSGFMLPSYDQDRDRVVTAPTHTHQTLWNGFLRGEGVEGEQITSISCPGSAAGSVTLATVIFLLRASVSSPLKRRDWFEDFKISVCLTQNDW